jgi:2-isopropylmalate synthase
MVDRVKIFDTTLRDGEQSPGISLNVGEKVEIAEQLARLGVDVIEAGFPISSEGDFDAVSAIAESVRGPVIAGLSRTSFADVDRCWEALRSAEKARIHVFISTSPIHIESMLRMTPDKVKEETAAAVARAKSYTRDVEFSAQDSTRTDPDFMCEVFRVAVGAGATTINVADTVGFSTPQEFGELVRYVIEHVPGAGDEVAVSTHCHNDLGLASANSLAGVVAGARQVECCVNGIGERAGNSSLEEVVMALITRPDFFGVETSVNTTEIARASRLVSRLTGYVVQPNKAVVGRNAFAHESGIHQHGVLVERRTYEIMDAEAVGQEGSKIVLGKHSGRHAFSDTLEKMGLRLQGDALNNAFRRFKELADRKVELTDADLEAIVAEELGSVEEVFRLESLEVSGGTEHSPQAVVRLRREAEIVEAKAEGDGMIDAACSAIREATGVSGQLVDFQVSSVTGGIDALGDVTVRLEVEGARVTGRGVSTDVVEASARAYLSAVNRAVRRRGSPRREPEPTP